MSVILCLLIYTPAYAVIPQGSVEHTVTILPGNGKILKNKDETFIENTHIVLNDLNDLEEIVQMQYQVVDGENLKDMLDYSNCDGTIYTATFNSSMIAKLNINNSLRPRWREVGFITSTRVVNHLLSLVEAAGYEFTSNYTDYYSYLPTGIHQLLIFIPPEEGYNFSHFVDQDGNTFDLNDSVTRDLILTPVYTTDDVEDMLDKTEEVFHQIKYEAGEGTIEYVKTHRDWDEKVNYCDGYREIDCFYDIVKDSKKINDRYDVIQSYAIYQDHDFPVAFNLLLKKETDCVEYLNNRDLYGAINELDESIDIASKYMFSSPYYYQEEVRPYSISLLAFLSNFTYNSQRLSDILINLLDDLIDAYLNWNSYTDEEKDEFIAECIETITAFENTARRFVDLYYSYMTPSDEKLYRFSGTNLEYWVRDDVYHIYHESDEVDRSLFYDGFWPTNKVVFVPPDGYEFDHFEDQYGNVFDPDTLITEDLVLTPIYKELHEYHLTFTKGEGSLRLYYRAYNEEANRTESFNDPVDELSIKLWRGKYTCEFDKHGEAYTASSNSSYTEMGLEPHGITLEESLYARSYWDQITAYGDNTYYLFIPPDNCVFDHFEDENGEVWEYGTELTKNTVVTPVYRSTLIDATINVVTEDNSNEEFDITLLRSFKNTMEEIYDKGDYDGTLLEYLNDKQSYHFDESDWVIAADGTITDYTGELVQMLGIPDTVNGIKVTGVATDAFASLYDRYLESYDGPYQSEAAYDYYSSVMALWIPKTVTQFSEGIDNEKLMNQYKENLYNGIREGLASQGKTEEEIETLLAYYEDIISLTVEESGNNNCTPFVYLPLAYAVVEEGNKNYVSRGGSLYDKDFKTLLFLSCAMRLDNLGYYYSNYEYENIGLEIPRKVEKISAFATFNAVYQEYGGYFPVYAYGDTNFENYFSYLVMELHYPEENFIENLCQEKFGKSYEEIVQIISTYNDPPDDMWTSFEEYEQRAFSDAREAGLMDDEGEPTVPIPEIAAFILPYYMEWLDNNPEYYLTELGLQFNMYKDGIVDVETDEYLVSESEAFAYKKAYIEEHSDGSFTLDQDGEFIPNFTEAEMEEIQAKLQIMEEQDVLNLEETREGLMIAYSLASFIMVTNPENAEAAKGPFLELLHAIDPEMSEEEIEDNLEFFNIIVQANTSFDGQINKYGKVSQTNPFKTSLNFYDSYTYTAYLTDIPDRYVTPNTVEIKPADEKYTGTIYLRLKRGNIEIETVDANNSSKHLEASYTIYDSNGNEVATITATGEIDAVGYGNLTYGTYTVVQTTVENGYLRNTDVKTASITEDGEIIRLTFSNHTTSGMYSVRIPKTIVLDGNTGIGSCVVSVMGTIDSTRQITVTPEQATFSLEEQNATVDKKSPIEASIESNKTKWLSSDLSETEWSSIVWNISAPLTAGCWYGRTNIIIQIKEKD